MSKQGNDAGAGPAGITDTVTSTTTNSTTISGGTATAMERIGLNDLRRSNEISRR